MGKITRGHENDENGKELTTACEKCHKVEGFAKIYFDGN